VWSRERNSPRSVCEVLASLRYIPYNDSFSMDPEDVRVQVCDNLELSKGTGLLCLGIRLWGTLGPSGGLGASGSKGLEPSYSHAPYNDVTVNDGPHIRRWSHKIIILTIVLQLPTVFSTVTCCTGL